MKIFLALIIYAVAVGIVLLVEHQFFARHDGHPVKIWIIEHIYEPLLRLAPIIIFVLAAYPDMFALRDAPSLSTILDGRPNWFSSMLNWAWIIMLLLPLLPVVGRLSAVILPIQAAALAALLFTWLAEFRGLQEFSYWPGGSAVTSMLVIAITGHFAAAWTAGLLAGRSDRADWHESIYDTVVLIFQAPAILIYTHSLGAQLL